MGQIRLDEEDGFNPIENDQVDVVVNKIVRGGIFTAAIVVATAKTILKIDRMLLEKVSNAILEDLQVIEIMLMFQILKMKKMNYLVISKII